MTTHNKHSLCPQCDHDMEWHQWGENPKRWAWCLNYYPNQPGQRICHCEYMTDLGEDE